MYRFGAQLHSSPGEEDSDDLTSRQNHRRAKPADDTQAVLTSGPFNVLRPLADRHRVLLRVATATLHHSTAAVNADDRDRSRGEVAGVETIRLVGGRQSRRLPSVTDDDVVAVVEKSPSDECGASAATGSDTGCPSPSPDVTVVYLVPVQ